MIFNIIEKNVLVPKLSSLVFFNDYHISVLLSLPFAQLAMKYATESANFWPTNLIEEKDSWGSELTEKFILIYAFSYLLNKCLFITYNFLKVINN